MQTFSFSPSTPHIFSNFRNEFMHTFSSSYKLCMPELKREGKEPGEALQDVFRIQVVAGSTYMLRCVLLKKSLGNGQKRVHYGIPGKLKQNFIMHHLNNTSTYACLSRFLFPVLEVFNWNETGRIPPIHSNNHNTFIQKRSRLYTTWYSNVLMSISHEAPPLNSMGRA